MVNAARENSPKLMLEFAYPPPPASEDTVMLIDPTEPMGLELTDALQADEEDSQWKVRCISVVPGSQADDYRLELPCALAAVGGRSVADRGFDYVLSVLELAKAQAVEIPPSRLGLAWRATSKWKMRGPRNVHAEPSGPSSRSRRALSTNGCRT